MGKSTQGREILGLQEYRYQTDFPRIFKHFFESKKSTNLFGNSVGCPERHEECFTVATFKVMVMQDIVFCAVQYCRAPIEKMLLYKSEEIRFAFITENLKDGGGGRGGRLAFQHMLILQ